MRPDAPARILIIKPSSLGDIVHALPALVILREAFPASHIAWLASSAFASLLSGHPLLNEVIVFDRGRYGKMLSSPEAFRGFWAFIGRLRTERFDLVVDLQGLFRSGFLALASGAEWRAGFAGARELAPLLYTLPVNVGPAEVHAVDRNVALAQAVVSRLTRAAPCDRRPEFPLGLSAAEQQAARERLSAALRVRARNGAFAHAPDDAEPPEFVVIAPGARWATKRWPVERWGDLLDRLHAENFPPAILLGGPDDAAFAEEIQRRAHHPAINWVGQTTLRELACILAECRGLICQDSGPMHLAAALDRPLVAIFGPTDPRRTGPYGRRVQIVRTAIDCAPCLRRSCWHHSCMQRLEVERVLSVARASLANSRTLQNSHNNGGAAPLSLMGVSNASR